MPSFRATVNQSSRDFETGPLLGSESKIDSRDDDLAFLSSFGIVIPIRRFADEDKMRSNPTLLNAGRTSSEWRFSSIDRGERKSNRFRATSWIRIRSLDERLFLPGTERF